MDVIKELPCIYKEKNASKKCNARNIFYFPTLLREGGSYVHSDKKVRMTLHTHKPRIADKTKPSARFRHYIYMYIYMSISSVFNILYKIRAVL